MTKWSLWGTGRSLSPAVRKWQSEAIKVSGPPRISSTLRSVCIGFEQVLVYIPNQRMSHDVGLPQTLCPFTAPFITFQFWRL